MYPSAPEQPPQAVYSIQLPSLPSVSLLWVTENALVAAGHDCQPVLYEGSVDQGWAQSRSLDDLKTSAAAARAGGAASGVGRLNKSEAFNVFKAADSRGVSQASTSPAGAGTRVTATGTELLTVHQNTVTCVRAYQGGGGEDVSQVSTSGVDGKLVIWQSTPGAGGMTSGVGRLGL